MTDTTTQAVTALLDGVTPGPWWHDNNEGYSINSVHAQHPTDRGAYQLVAQYIGDSAEAEANAIFAAAARDLVPDLLADRNALAVHLAAAHDERDALAAALAAAETRARESALDAIAAYGQAAEAHTAQLAAEAKLATARGALADLVSWFDGGPSSHGPWIIASGDHGADDAVAVARALVKDGE